MGSSPPTKNNSCVLGGHAGNFPPVGETSHLPPGPGNERTNTSLGPNSLDAYANLPSGESPGATSTNGPVRKMMHDVRSELARVRSGRLIAMMTRSVAEDGGTIA